MFIGEEGVDIPYPVKNIAHITLLDNTVSYCLLPSIFSDPAASGDKVNNSTQPAFSLHCG